MSRKKATINRIYAHLCKSADVEEVWSKKNLEKMLDKVSVKNLVQLENGAYKVKLKLCQVQIFVDH